MKCPCGKEICKNHFICGYCHQEFIKGKTDEEATKEFETLHPNEKFLEYKGEPVYSCHECWLKHGK